MKQTDIYNAAIAIAQASIDNPNQVKFEADMANKAVALDLNQGEFNMFTQEARNVRSKLFQYKQQDDQAARNAPKVAAPQAQAVQTPAPAKPAAPTGNAS